MNVRFLLLTYNPYSEPEWEHLDEFIWGLCIVAVPVVIIGVLIGLRKSDKLIARAKRLAALAGELGLEFSYEDEAELSSILDQATSLTDEECSMAYSVMSGTFGGRRIWACDCSHGEWRHTSDGEKLEGTMFRETLESLSSVALAPHKWTLSRITIGYRSALSRVLSELEDDRPEFVGAEFNRQYCVYCKDPNTVERVLQPEVVSFLLDNPGWTVELFEQAAVVSNGKRWKPGQFREALEFLAGLVERLPAELSEVAKTGE